MSDVPETQGGQMAAPEIVLPKTPVAVEVPQATAPVENAETATTSEQNAPPDDAGAEPTEAKKRRGVQKRIDELTAEREDARRDRDHWRELAQKQISPARAEAATVDPDLKEPREADYTSYDDYLRSRDEYLVEKGRRATLKELEARAKTVEAEKARTEQARKFKEARDRFEKTADSVAEHYEDFDDAMADMWAGKIPVIAQNDTVAEFIVEVSERGPELAYHLRSNPAEAERIAKLSPLAAVRELTRIEANLPKPETRSVSKAPPPAKPVKATGGAGLKDIEAMAESDMAAYSRLRAEQRKSLNTR